jgi:hypothetical protein
VCCDIFIAGKKIKVGEQADEEKYYQWITETQCERRREILEIFRL